MGADFSFQIWHARIAHFQSVPVEDSETIRPRLELRTKGT